jgi:hypothetical protein
MGATQSELRLARLIDERELVRSKHVTRTKIVPAYWVDKHVEVQMLHPNVTAQRQERTRAARVLQRGLGRAVGYRCGGESSAESRAAADVFGDSCGVPSKSRCGT